MKGQQQQNRRKSGEQTNENESSSSLNFQNTKGDNKEGIKAEQLLGISQSALGQNDVDSVISLPGSATNNQKGQGNTLGGIQHVKNDQLGKQKSKSMIHSGSNLQGNSQITNSNNHLFLTTQGNNYNTNSGSNLVNLGGQYKHIEQFPKIQEAYGQLNSMVEFLEEKVDGVIERHEAELLLAYKNHMIQIRKELQEIKNRMDEQDKKLKAGDKMDQLEKQLSWFRDESLKLYDKLGQKDKQISDFKHIIADQKKDMSFQEGQIQQLKKKIRILVRKVSGTVENFNPDDRSASSVSGQNYYLGSSHINENMNQSHNNHSNSFSVTSQLPNNFGRGKGVESHQIFNQNRRPLSSEYSQNYTRYQTNGSTAQLGNNQYNSNYNINNLSTNNIQLSSLNHNLSNNQYNLLGDVAEQNETQNSQLNNEDQISNNNQYNTMIRNTKNQINEGIQDFWIPQSEFIAEMVTKYQNDHIALVREITHMFKIEDEKKQKIIKQQKDRLDKTLKDKLTQNVLRSDLENFFLECIETVRKQIIKRKPPPKNGDSHLNFYLKQIKDYSIFRNEDKIKILELLLSNERLMMYIYQKIFPQNFNKYMNQAVNSTVGTSLNQGGSSLTQQIQSQNDENNQKTYNKKIELSKNGKLSGKHLNAEDLANIIEDNQFENYQKDNDELTPVHKLSIQQQLEKVTRPKTRENDLSQVIISGNRQRPMTQQNQVGGRRQNYSFDQSEVNLSFQNNNNKKSSHNSFSIDQSLNQNNNQLYQPVSTKQKINSLMNNDFSNFNQSNKPSFKSKKATFQMY